MPLYRIHMPALLFPLFSKGCRRAGLSHQHDPQHAEIKSAASDRSKRRPNRCAAEAPGKKATICATHDSASFLTTQKTKTNDGYYYLITATVRSPNEFSDTVKALILCQGTKHLGHMGFHLGLRQKLKKQKKNLLRHHLRASLRTIFSEGISIFTREISLFLLEKIKISCKNRISN